MADWIHLIGPQQAVEIFGIRLVGINAENGRKVVLTILLIGAIFLIAAILKWAAGVFHSFAGGEKIEFWARQGISLFSGLCLIIALASIWFDDPARLATAIGLITAGLAFALQKVVSAVAGYFVILRGNTFNVGDRITMGGVRGDVIALGIIQTTIMEMGEPPSVQNSEPAMWVKARQYSGRIVTVPNSKIFDEPVYNYTRDFPFVWEEMTVMLSYSSERETVEEILLEAAKRHTVDASSMSAEAVRELKRRYFMQRPEIEPKVYFRITDDRLNATVRFVVEEHGIREVKDAMSREILKKFESAGLQIASSSLEITALPPLKIGPLKP